MISCLIISCGGGDAVGLYFDCGFLRNMDRFLQCHHHAYLEVIGDPLKIVTQLTFVRNSFHEGHHADQNTPYKR